MQHRKTRQKRDMRLIRLLKKDLAKETTFWVAERIISPEQAARICSQYGIDYYNQSKQSYGYFILTILGFLFIGLAIITIVGANWESIPRGVRMLSLILLTLLVNIVGIYKTAKGETSLAIGCFFFGGLLYGASIMLIAQIYHLGEHYPDGIFWWAIGVLPLGLLLESSLLLFLSTVLGCIWFFVESSLGFYPALFPIFLTALAWHCLTVKKSTVLFLTLVSGVCFWLEYSFSWMLGDFRNFKIGAENIVLGFSLFLLLYGLANWLAAKKKTLFEDYGILLGLWVLRFAVLSLFVYSFKWPWLQLLREKWSFPILALCLTIFLSTLTSWITYYCSRKRFIFISIVSGIYISILLLAISLPTTMASRISLFFQVLDNIVLVLSGTWLIFYGIRHSITHYFFFGVTVILLTGLLRYIDLVGDYVGAAILFSVFAIILLSAAYFWKSHHSRSNVLL